jgi:hypothetical protein
MESFIMKKPIRIILICSITVIFFFLIGLFLDFKHKNEFDKKDYWAICIENQGMITHEIYLCNDSTFYTNILTESIFGRYAIKGDMIYFYPPYNHLNSICNVYTFENKKGVLFPICKGFEILKFEKIKGKLNL